MGQWTDVHLCKKKKKSQDNRKTPINVCLMVLYLLLCFKQTFRLLILIHKELFLTTLESVFQDNKICLQQVVQGIKHLKITLVSSLWYLNLLKYTVT